MSSPLKWSVQDCASALYACGFHSEGRDMISNKPIPVKRNSKEKKIRAEIESDTDFIVFEFYKDGKIDLVKDKSPPPNQDRPKDRTHHRSKASKKLAFGGSSEGLQFKLNEDGVMISDNEGEEESNNSRKKLSPSDVKGGVGDEIEVVTATEENTERRTLSESSRSDGSAESFTFPVVKLETVGSPEKMPKSSEQSKIERMLRFPCCNF